MSRVDMSRIVIGLLVRLQNLLLEEQGQDLVEYGLVLLFVVLVCIGTVSPLATYVNGSFSKISTSIA